MKKIIILIAACSLLFGSCSQSEPAAGEVTGAVTFKVTAVNSIQTRGDIYTSSATGTVLPAMTGVQVLAFKDDGSDNFVYTQTIDLTAAYNASINSAQQTLADGTIAAGNYKFLGVGRMSASDGYTLTTLVEGVTNYNDVTARIFVPSSFINVIFAGTKEQEVLPTGANIEFEITRQVAGIFAYTANVPVDILGTTVQYLRLRISNANRVINLGTGEGDSATGQFYDALIINLLNQTRDEVNNVYKGAVPPTGVVLAENAQIASNYAVPVDGVTMQLALQDASGTDLKVWNLQDADGGTIDLKPNVLLAIGTKNVAGSIWGADGLPGGVGDNADDAPASLLTDETIVVTISKNWKEVQNLTLVEQ